LLNNSKSKLPERKICTPACAPLDRDVPCVVGVHQLVTFDAAAGLL
jgi:hypothetical protein